MEVIIVAVIIIGVLLYNHTIDKDKFIKDNTKYFNLLREDDYDFLVSAKYGDKVDSDVLFQKRINIGVITIFVVLFVSLNSISLLNILLAVVIGYVGGSNGDLPKRHVQAVIQPSHAAVSQRTPAGFYAGGHLSVSWHLYIPVLSHQDPAHTF